MIAYLNILYNARVIYICVFLLLICYIYIYINITSYSYVRTRINMITKSSVVRMHTFITALRRGILSRLSLSL